MGGNIYLMQADGQLAEMVEHSYESESLLQELLGRYPGLLAGDQIDSTVPRRWLLISREIGIYSNEQSIGRLDHFFVDQDAVPTFVEVKRSNDTRIRREVVGQMLDYAANASLYWDVDYIWARFEAKCEAQGINSNEELSAFLDEETDPKEFWEEVQENLRNGKVRMLFVADVIPPELQRIVEFLNQQMDRTEVLAIEIHRYMGHGTQALVPRIVGQTVEAQKKKSRTRTQKKRKWNSSEFFENLKTHAGDQAVHTAEKILNWANQEIRVWWGEGIQDGSFVPILDFDDRQYQLFAVYTSGGVLIYFQWLQYKPPFDSEEKRRELLQYINGLEGVSFSEEVITKRPNIPLKTLTRGKNLQQFLAIFDWVISEIRRT